MNSPPGFRRRSPLLAALGRNSRHIPASPRVVVAQVGVSPINRTMPAAVLNTTAPQFGDQAIRGNPGATTPPVTPVAPDPAVFQRGNTGTVAPTSHSAPMQAAAQPSDVNIPANLPALLRATPQSQPPQNLQALLPQIHGLITQMLAGNRPAAWQNVLGQQNANMRGLVQP